MPKTLPAAPAATETCILVTGVEESVKNDKFEARVKQLLYEQMEVESPVHRVETVRLGRQTENRKGPRPVIVTLRSPAERSAVLRSAHRLKELNLELRQRASRTIGIDVFLSREKKGNQR